jgi:anti-anti-sigma regulatory factor
MWKVQRTEDGGLVVLQVSGRIEGENLAELRKVFTAETENQGFVLDMSEVRLVDQDSIDFLSRCEANGAVLRNCPAYIREWIERERETESSC